MQQGNITFSEIDDNLTIGITEIYSNSLGMCTFVGYSKEGDAVLQNGDHFTAIPELSWNIMNFVLPFQPETHVRYITESDLSKLHLDDENFLQATLATKSDMIYQYEVVLEIRRVYDKLGQ